MPLQPPLTTAMAVLPGFSRALGLEGARAHYCWEHHRQEECARGRSCYSSQRGACHGLMTLAAQAYSTMILCAKPCDGYWGTVDAGIKEVEDGGSESGGRVCGTCTGTGSGTGVVLNKIK